MTLPRSASWWNRNWKWFVPVAVLAVLAFAGLCLALLLGAVFGALKSTTPYGEAVAMARQDARVQAALGTPLKEGWFLSGNVFFTNDVGKAALTIPLSGPKGEASLEVLAFKQAGTWSYSNCVVVLPDNQTRIDLLEKAPSR